MNDDPRLPLPAHGPSPDDHPVEAMAAYVEGSATQRERDLVEAHIARCRSCRDDLGMARAGRDALRALPELPPPGLRDEVLRLAARERDRPAEVIDLAARRRFRWDRLAAGAGVAAALIVAVVVLPRLFSGGVGAHTAAAPARAGAERTAGERAGLHAPPLVNAGTRYNATSLATLAKALAGREEPFQGIAPVPAPSGLQTPAAAVPDLPASIRGAKSPQSGIAANQALACVERGAGLPASTPTVYLEAAALNGRPVYIAAFRTSRQGSHPYLLVVAASRDACTPLQIISQRV